MSDDIEVTVEVDSSPESEPESTPVVVVSTPSESDSTLDHERRITILETTLADLVGRVDMIGFTASSAENLAEVALDAVDSVAAETEEALATVAEEADAVTPEVIQEVEDVAPNREHPWLAPRSFKDLLGKSS